MFVVPYYSCCLFMAIMAVFVFVALYFVKAGYGIFRTRRWGWAIDNRWGWVLMEAPAFAVMALALAFAVTNSGSYINGQTILLSALFLLHYFQRSFIFPLLMRGKSRMPVSIMLMGVVFNVLNAAMLGWGLFISPVDMRPDVAVQPLSLPFGEWLLQPNVVMGLVLFFMGMGINLHSDHVIRHLRQPGDTRHYLPSRGIYRYVTSANYFGELVEWTGLSVASMIPAAWVFVWWTAANLVPRAHAIHKRYRQEFGEAVAGRKRIIPFVY